MNNNNDNHEAVVVEGNQYINVLDYSFAAQGSGFGFGYGGNGESPHGFNE
jgi:hypothetical protein